MDSKGPPASQPKGMGSKFAYEQIKRAIIEGRLRPDLPISERDMIAEFSISRTPLREAITRLSAENLVVLRANKSTTVADPIPSGIAAFLTAKACIDRAICYSAARRLEPGTTATLRARAAALAQNNAATFADVHRLLQAIADTARNRYLTTEFFRLHENSVRLSYLNDCVEAYRAVLIRWCLGVAEAILNADAIAAREAAKTLATHLAELFPPPKGEGLA